MDRLKFAKFTGGWLLLLAVLIWLSGPVAAIVLPQQTACGPGTIPCRTLAALVQLTSAILAVALFGFVLLRLCYRRIADTGLNAMWQLLGVIPFWLCSQELTHGALTAGEIKLLLAIFPDYAMKPPLSLTAALVAAAVIGLIPSVAPKTGQNGAV